MFSDTEILIRFMIAVIIGSLIGLSRRKKAAGIRTFALICLGSTIFTIISIIDIYGAPYDPTRIIAQIVAGIGFLGVGVIWKNGLGKPSGLTTAAVMWVTAGIGIMVGLGLWVPVLVGAVLVLTVVYAKKRLLKAKLEDDD